MNSSKVISRHASDIRAGLGFPENVKRDPCLKSAFFKRPPQTAGHQLITRCQIKCFLEITNRLKIADRTMFIFRLSTGFSGAKKLNCLSAVMFKVTGSRFSLKKPTLIG